ncbi:prephenate dehydratase domain-containing protein [Desulfotalea psychrophila]|uniref:Prephenate dehydrogenase n=1 Tax=Desulfotalea psychrophila (strain LSv54 / DSM 12343) TaxID=177439 RepID=Q6AKX1_DESPS|nr:prephenate dehydratase domain-containing protein [Desulfotalea psychrophila]CAG37004.1 related to P-protein [Desulfotalea psychrophila LSv54]
MPVIAILGPIFSNSHRAASLYSPSARIVEYQQVTALQQAFVNGDADYIVLPVYNTREGEIKKNRHLVEKMGCGSWIDNIILPINLSLGRLSKTPGQIKIIISTDSVFRQCHQYINERFPEVTRMAVADIGMAIEDIRAEERDQYAIIESEEFIREHGLDLMIRELVPHNKTRYAVIGKDIALATGYDATAFITKPLRDRVGILSDILGEFTRRGINILDLQSENDIKTQKLRIYLELEGHMDSPNLQGALAVLENKIIQEEGAFRLLGSFPRVDMRVKNIHSFGFIGSGAMSRWFADRLGNEGYETFVTGRSTPLTPREMIAKVDVVMVCVPISVTASTIKQYGPLLRDGQAMIILAGESERNIAAAMEATSPGVEVMFVHNLWGPQALTMKDKNVNVVRTVRSGSFSSEFEAFLYKHGADIHHDTESQHDLLMGLGQKLPTAISIAIAMTLHEHGIGREEIESHSTLTSIYGILAMARIHNQNSRTYAEIMATKGEGWKIVESFKENLEKISTLAEQGKIGELAEIMDVSAAAMDREFLETKMRQAKAVDEILANPGF